MRLFVYFSELLDRQVVDIDNQPIGKLYDLSVRIHQEVFPKVEHIIVYQGLLKKKYATISFEEAFDFGEKFKLSISKENLKFQDESGMPLNTDIAVNLIVDKIADRGTDGTFVVKDEYGSIVEFFKTDAYTDIEKRLAVEIEDKLSIMLSDSEDEIWQW